MMGRSVFRVGIGRFFFGIKGRFRVFSRFGFFLIPDREMFLVVSVIFVIPMIGVIFVLCMNGMFLVCNFSPRLRKVLR